MPNIAASITGLQPGGLWAPNSEMVPKCSPKLTRFAEFTGLTVLLNLAVPFVGAFENFEYRGELRVSNSHNAHLQGKEGERGHCMLVEPANGREVLIPKTFGDPNNDLGF